MTKRRAPGVTEPLQGESLPHALDAMLHAAPLQRAANALHLATCCAVASVDHEPTSSTTDDEEDGPLDIDSLGDLLDTTDPGEVVDQGDELPSSLDIGLDLLDEDDDARERGNTELVLDIEALLSTDSTQEDSFLGDEQGPLQATSYAELDDLPPVEDRQAESDDGQALGALVERGLPRLDEDEDDADGPLSAFKTNELEGVTRDEPLPPQSTTPWSQRALRATLPAAQALALVDTWVVVGGQSLCWIDRASNASPQCRSTTTRIVSLARGGSRSMPEVIAATADGALVRAVPQSSKLVRLSDWRRACAAGPDEAVTLDLCTADTPDRLMARTTTGRLLRTTDGGLTFDRVELHGKVTAISPSAEPAVVVLESRGRRRIARSCDGGINWEVIEASCSLAAVLADEGILLAATGDIIAVAHPAHGLWVCTQAGGFRRVPGCCGATALTAAHLGAHGGIWLAVFQELSQCSHLVAIDPLTHLASRIATLRPPQVRDQDPHEDSDWARVQALVVDNGGRLWAAGGFGVTTWSSTPLLKEAPL